MSPTLAARRARSALWIFVGVGSALLVIGLVVGVTALLDLTTAVRATQIEGTPTGQKLLQSSDRILDCTDPEGDCYVESQQRTAAVVADIVDQVNANTSEVVILAASCAGGLPEGLNQDQRERRISACVIAQLAARH